MQIILIIVGILIVLGLIGMVIDFIKEHPVGVVFLIIIVALIFLFWPGAVILGIIWIIYMLVNKQSVKSNKQKLLNYLRANCGMLGCQAGVDLSTIAPQFVSKKFENDSYSNIVSGFLRSVENQNITNDKELHWLTPALAYLEENKMADVYELEKMASAGLRVSHLTPDGKLICDAMKGLCATRIINGQHNVMYWVFDALINDDGRNFCPDATRLLNSKKVSDHHAIIPTAEIKAYDIGSLPEKEKKILYLISFRLLSAAAAPCEYTVLKAELTIHDLMFKASGKHIEKEGYKHYEDLLKAAWKQEQGNADDEEDLSDTPMANLTEGQEIKAYETALSEGTTKAPSRYTEDSLLAAMENAGAKETTAEAERKGIGTPATRADIIEKLIHDGYVNREKKNLVATDLGTKLVAILPEELKSASLTAEWENDLTLIAKGEASAEEFLSAIEAMVCKMVDTHTKPDFKLMVDLEPYRHQKKSGYKKITKTGKRKGRWE